MNSIIKDKPTIFKYKKFIIFSGSYSEDSGGTVVLHQLCHLLNTNGYEAYLYPAFIFKLYSVLQMTHNFIKNSTK
jgi:hypothetical protein